MWDTGYAKQTIQNAIHEVTASCVNSAWITQQLHPNWGGYLAVDGSYIRVYDQFAKYFPYSRNQRRFIHKLVWLVGLDLKTLDVVHHHLGDEETMIDLMLFWQQVKANGYPLKGLVSDGNKDILRSAQKVFVGQKVLKQHCIRHYLERLRERFRLDKINFWDYDVFQASIQTQTPIKLLPKELFTYLDHPELPRTNQQIENLFRQARLRLKTIGLFNSHKTAFNYLNAWTLFRRFTPFTDSRDITKNGKAPLELAGCNIQSLDYLELKKHTQLGR